MATRRRKTTTPDSLPVPGAPSKDAVEWEIRAVEMRLAGMDDIKVLQELTEAGATTEQAMTAYTAMMTAAGKKASEINLAVECLFGMMNARAIYRAACEIGDLETQIAAEKLRAMWTDKLAKLRPPKEDDGKRTA